MMIFIEQMGENRLAHDTRVIYLCMLNKPTLIIFSLNHDSNFHLFKYIVNECLWGTI